MAKTDIKVSVERAAHDAIIELAAKLWKDYGLAITDVSINWEDDNMIGGHRWPSEVQIRTQTRWHGLPKRGG